MKTWCWTAGAAFFLWAGAFPGRAAEKESEHLLVQLAYEKGEFTLVQSVAVGLPLPKSRDGKERGDWRVTLTDRKGREVFQTRFSDPRVLRVELEPPGQQPVRRVIIREGRVDFNLRLPALAGSLLFERKEWENGKTVWKALGSCELPASGGRP